MQIYPAIDLKGGACVRLYQGDFANSTVYHDDPVTIACRFAEHGTTWLHVIDLDAAARPDDSQITVIKKIATVSGLSLQVGGGIRSYVQIQQLFDIGIKRIIIGSLAITNPDLVNTWVQEFGSDKIAIAVDTNITSDNIPYVAMSGWQQTSALTIAEVLQNYNDSNIKHVLCTDISRDGVLQGPNFALYQNLKSLFPNIAWQASGGIHCLEDIKQLQALQISGVIVGKALYENYVTLDEILSC